MAIIKLTQGKEAIVDDDLYEELSKHRWFFSRKNKNGHGYAQRSQHVRLGFKKYLNKGIYLHREVLKTELEVDHIDGNTLNNRRANLRPATRQQQVQNRRSVLGSTSGFVGVHLHKGSGKWRAQINIDGKVTSLGLFETEEAAYKARLKFIEENQLERFRR